jgi:MFS family permease
MHTIFLQLLFMGALLGSASFGLLCDRMGRRKPLFVATAIIAVSMFVSLAAPSYWVFAALRAVTGFGAAGQSHCNFLISTESVGPGYR